MTIGDPTVGEGVCAHMRALAFVCAYCACFLSSGAHADLIVPASGQTSLSAGVVDLSCTDVIVSGTLKINSGSLKNVRNLTIQAGGVVEGGSGLIEVGGNWSNSGSFVAGTGTVNFRELCAAGVATISGNTTFYGASFVSAIGRNYVFAVGSTQTITSLLRITGTGANPIKFSSSASGQVAYINLLNNGTQQIQHVGVTDVWATGQWLAPFQTNEGGGGNANRWFGTPSGGGAARQTRIPTIENGALAALMVLLAATGAWLTRRRARTRAASQERT